MKALKILVIVTRIGLGCLFVYGGIKKFQPSKRPQTEASVQLPDHVVKIKSFIGGMKQTQYFWEFLGVVELTAGILILSQYLALLGAFLLLPVTTNIFLFHLFLEPHDIGELLMTGLYLIGNLFLIGYHYQDLKVPFFKLKPL